MAVLSEHWAAADATVNTDILRNNTQNVTSRNRVIQAVALTGSAAINDTAGDLYVGNVKVATLYNTRAGVIAPLRDDIIALGNVLCKAGDKISFIITDAPLTNPIDLRVYYSVL